MLYAVAGASGFRASELASLTPAHFDLRAEPPTVSLGAADAKNGQTATQPLPAELAESLAAHVNGRPLRQPLWPGTWPEKAAEMFRIELDAAGVAYAVD